MSKLILSCVVLLATNIATHVVAQNQSINLPKPTGTHAVGTTTYQWVDQQRLYSFSKHDKDKRRIVVQTWYPSSNDPKTQKAPYSVFSNELKHVRSNSQLLPAFANGLSSCPLILISPGRGMKHYAYSAIAESLASNGYVVAAVGMPDIGYVAFSDGYIAKPNPDFQPSRELMSGPYEKVDKFFETPTEIGRQDLEFALTQLRKLNEADPNGRFTGKIDLTTIGMFGHSLGGRIAGVLAADSTNNVKAYISMEGIAPRRARFEGMLSMPVAMMCSSGTLPYAKDNYQTLIDGRKETVFMIELQKFGHNSVTDLPFVSPDQFNYGIDPETGLLTSIQIINAFFDSYLKEGVNFKGMMDGIENVVVTEYSAKDKESSSQCVITNCNVVSVKDGRIIPNQMILIKDGLIALTGPMQESSVPEFATVVEGTDKYVMPGLVDMHVHIGHESELLSYLINGVTTVCNMSGDYVDLFSDERIDILKLKKQVASGSVIGPAIYSAGQALDGDPRTGPYQRALPNAAAAAEAVMEQKKNGFDFIKIYDSMDEQLLKTITRTAGEAELAVVGHIPENVSINKLLNSGVKLIAHGEEFYPEFEDSEDFELTARNLAKRVKEAGVAVTPNSAFIRRMIDQLEDLPKVLEDPKVKTLAPRVKRWWNPRYNFYTTRDEPAKFLEQTKRKYEWLIIFVRELHKAGVPLLTGTDALIPGALPGYSMTEEFKDLETARLSPAEILRTATINPAKFIIDNTSASTPFGEVREGYRADLVLLNQNPLENISALGQSIIGVVFNGRWATKESLRELLDEQVRKFDR